jgi:CRP/FNR family transcriptional regulator
MRDRTVFCDMSQHDLRAMSAVKVYRGYQRGEVIFSEGDRPVGVYCLFRGSVKIFKSGRDGREQIIRLVRPGDVFGYRALLSAHRHDNCAAALDDVGVCYVPRAMFMTMAAENTDFSFKMLELLSGELRRAEEHVVEMVQKTLRERLAETLLLCRERFGLERDGVTLGTRVTRGEIAEMVGAATESVIRQMMRFKDEGLIGLKGRRISILSPERLLDAANLEE